MPLTGQHSKLHPIRLVAGPISFIGALPSAASHFYGWVVRIKRNQVEQEGRRRNVT